MDEARIDDLPGYRRRIVVESVPGVALAMLEDDFHAMAVTLRHDGSKILSIDPLMDRAPWTTCPGAVAQLRSTFASGMTLAEVNVRHEKRINCTHLHDLAVLAAAHAKAHGRVVYEVLVSDPVADRRELELRRDGEVLFRWAEHDRTLVEPAEIAGQSLHTLRDWIRTLPEDLREPARVLQWAGMVGRGRAVMATMTDRKVDRPPDCFASQPERVEAARRVGEWIDFSDAGERRLPLERLEKAGALSGRPSSS